MNVSTLKVSVPDAEDVTVTDDTLTAELSDGRTISVPLSWYPRLIHARLEERNNWRLIGAGEGVHWPDLDEDISVEMLLGGWPSGESQRSFKQWLAAKREGRGLTIYELNAYEKERQQQGDDGPVRREYPKAGGWCAWGTWRRLTGRDGTPLSVPDNQTPVTLTLPMAAMLSESSQAQLWPAPISTTSRLFRGSSTDNWELFGTLL